MSPNLFLLSPSHVVAEMPELDDDGHAFELHLVVIDGGHPLAWWCNADGSWTGAATVGQA